MRTTQNISRQPSYQIQLCPQRGQSVGRCGRSRFGPIDSAYDLISAQRSAMLDMTLACVRGEGHGALADATAGHHPLLPFPAYTEIGNEQLLLLTEEDQARLQLCRMRHSDQHAEYGKMPCGGIAAMF